ncbi:hypothetical protein [Bacteroides sp. 51]|uniref:hypothetical protein n=1 Tax=Bacteroides sp. 51 TaxID=2302938 RepID=UPI0013D2E2A5|nr:hypothetical protein [Bacteroides sp. 51]NDV83384.1 hypothetical protein [Bacteroides sp. 51]
MSFIDRILGRIGVITPTRDTELLKAITENNGNVDRVFSNDREMNAFISKNEMSELYNTYSTSNNYDERFDCHEEFFSKATQKLTDKDPNAMFDMWQSDKKIFQSLGTENNHRIEQLILKYKNIPSITEEQVKILFDQNISNQKLYESGIVKDLLNTKYGKNHSQTIEYPIGLSGDQVTELHLLKAKSDIGKAEYNINIGLEKYDQIEEHLYAFHQKDILQTPSLNIEPTIRFSKESIYEEITQNRALLLEETDHYYELRGLYDNKEIDPGLANSLAPPLHHTEYLDFHRKYTGAILPEEWEADLSALNEIKSNFTTELPYHLIDKYKLHPHITEKQISIINQNLTPDSSRSLMGHLLHTQYAEVNKISSGPNTVSENVTELHILKLKCKIAEMEYNLDNATNFSESINREMRFNYLHDREIGAIDLDCDDKAYTNHGKHLHSITDKNISSLENELRDNRVLLMKYQNKYDSSLPTITVSQAEKLGYSSIADKARQPYSENTLFLNSEVVSSGNKMLIADIKANTYPGKEQTLHFRNYRIRDMATGKIEALHIKDIDLSKQPADSLRTLLSGGKADLTDKVGVPQKLGLTKTLGGWGFRAAQQAFASMDAAAES